MAAPHWISPDELVHVPYGASPLSKLGENINHLYRYHSPALVNLALVNTGSATTASYTYIFAMPASTDAEPPSATTNYRMEVHGFTDQSTTLTAQLYWQAGQSTSTWNTAFSASGTVHGDGWVRGTGGLRTDVTHGKLVISSSGGLSDIVPHCVIIYPQAPLSLPTVKTDDGFIPYVSTVLESVTGAGIHREMLNRFRENVRVILRARKQAVFGYADTETATHRFSNATNSSALVAVTGAHLPGQRGATITVRYRITDIAGGTSNKAYLAELGGETVALTVDDTDRTATMVLASEEPQFKITAVPNTALEIKYIQADWVPGD
jgi:hypothetical protein